MMRRRVSALFIFGGIGITSCTSPDPISTPHGVEIVVAPLNLPGIGVACYDVQVSTANDVVWSKGDPARTLLGHHQPAAPNALLPAAPPGDATTICSDRYGNGAGGDITYVGTCDASDGADTGAADGVQNTVTLWVDGLYNGAKTVEMGEWQDPCPNGCQLQVDCVENQDSLVEFNLTIMREANQGFFDIAVNFEDIFCSAKLDTCYEGGAHIRLLHGSDSDATRDWTAVFGFACTAGAGDAATTLLYGNLEVRCGSTHFPIDPTDTEGNHRVTVAGHTLNYAIYYGMEQLECDDAMTTTTVESCNKAYWNLAFSLDDLDAVGAACTLQFSATATDGNAGFTDGLPDQDGVSYPYIDVDATLTPATCLQYGLNDGGGVGTVYHGTVDGLPPAATMCSQFDATGAGPVAGAVCGTQILPAPTIVRSSPVEEIGLDPTPEFTISGVIPGATVELFSDACVTKVGQANAAGTSVVITSAPIVKGRYQFYARQRNVTGVSQCSIVYADYHLSGTPMVTQWLTTVANETITLPFRTTFEYHLLVDWGDGSPLALITAGDDLDATHAYATAGTHTVTLMGSAGTWYFNDTGDKTKLLQVNELGDLDWLSLSAAFFGCTNLTTFGGGDTSKVTSMYAMFKNADQVMPVTTDWNTSNVTRMESMFYGATAAEPDTSNWDTSQVIRTDYMFYNAINANPDTSNWDTSSNTMMLGMFQLAASANPDMSAWQVGNVTTFASMFLGVTLPTATYSGLLVAIEESSALNTVPLGGGGSKYGTNAAAAHAALVNRGWIISDGGPE